MLGTYASSEGYADKYDKKIAGGLVLLGIGFNILHQHGVF